MDGTWNLWWWDNNLYESWNSKNTYYMNIIQILKFQHQHLLLGFYPRVGFAVIIRAGRPPQNRQTYPSSVVLSSFFRPPSTLAPPSQDRRRLRHWRGSLLGRRDHQVGREGHPRLSCPWSKCRYKYRYNKLASLEATLVRNSAHPLTYLLTHRGKV